MFGAIHSITLYYIVHRLFLYRHISCGDVDAGSPSPGTASLKMLTHMDNQQLNKINEIINDNVNGALCWENRGRKRSTRKRIHVASLLKFINSGNKKFKFRSAKIKESVLICYILVFNRDFSN